MARRKKKMARRKKKDGYLRTPKATKAKTAGFCEHCELPALVDHRGQFECARCKRERAA